MTAEPVRDERTDGGGPEGADDAQVRDRIADLLESSPTDAEGDTSHRRHHRHHRHHHHHSHKKRLTPRPAKLQWWHILLILLVGLLVTWVVVAIASSPAGPPPE